MKRIIIGLLLPVLFVLLFLTGCTDSSSNTNNYNFDSSYQFNQDSSGSRSEPVDDGCCKHCSVGQACGDSCISRSYECHQPPGCACDN